MELRQLRVFVTVAEERHFGRAAQRLYLAQPSISRHIRQLETELGVRLLHRTARQVELTDAGAVFLPDARRIVGQADSAALNLRCWQSDSQSRLRVGYVADAAPSVLPGALRRLSVADGAPRLHVSSATPDTLVRQALDRRLDAALVSLPAPVGGLLSTTITREDAVVAVSRAALERGEATEPLEVVASGTLLTRPRHADPGFHDAVVVAFRAAGLPSPLVEVESTSVQELLLRVVAGAGMALVPASVSEQLRTHNIAFRRLTGAAPIGCEIAFVTLRDRAGDPHVARLLQALRRPVTAVPAVAAATATAKSLGRVAAC